jgi:two-component system response regulator NreC
MPTKILIVDDHGVLRAGLQALLSTEPDMEVVGVAADGQEALKGVLQLQPDVVLMDISLGELNGIDVTRQLHETRPESRVLILTVHEEIHFLQQALEAGAAGYILKKANMNDVIYAIQAVMMGGLYIHPDMTRKYMAISTNLIGQSGATQENPLSQREIEILHWIAQGFTNTHISKQLGISIRTVEYHRRNIMAKIGINSRDQLVQYARDHNL